MTKNSQKATLVRIYVNEDDRFHGRPMYEAILYEANEMRLAGCTVLRGVEGFGGSTMIHSARMLRSSEDLPMVVEVIESRNRLGKFLGRVESMLAEVGCGGMVTFEDVDFVRYPSSVGH